MRKSPPSTKKRLVHRAVGLTERQLVRAQKALQEKTEKLADSLAMVRAALESITDAIVLTDGEHKMTAFNDKYAEMMGMSRETVETGDVQ